MDFIDLPLEQLIPYSRNLRKNAGAIATVAASLAEFGWHQPIVVDEDMVILAGHTRLEAARQLGLATAPVHVPRGLTPAQAKAYRLMDNRASENAQWDEALLGLEFLDFRARRSISHSRDFPTPSWTNCSPRRSPAARPATTERISPRRPMTR